MKKYFLIPFFCVNLAIAQDGDDGYTKVTPESALAKFKVENYEDALIDYLQLLNEDNKNIQYNYNVGVCYLNSNLNKAKAVPYLEIVNRNEKHDPNSLYLLGRAYQFANRFDEAIKSFNKFKLEAKGSIYNLDDADLQIQYCINAKELMKYPVDVHFQNLGKNINSGYNDYYPFVTADESYIVYNTKRPEKNAEKLLNGSYNNSIYMSKVKDGDYTKAQLIGSPIDNGNSGMEVVGLSANGEVMLLYKPEGPKTGNLFLSKLEQNGKFSKPEKLDPKINSGGQEIAASISQYGNILFFASNRKGGFGGTDIYICKIVPSGAGGWSEPQNAGPNINTPLDDDFPNLSPDGKTLYFSSKGHASMGGYDIFKSEYESSTNTFSAPKNIGYPINTTDDDMNFRISKNGKFGYIASSRNDGIGEFDIYRVNFNEVASENSVVIGELKAKDNSAINYTNVFITITNITTKELVGNYLPNPNNGRFIAVLTPGKYKITIEATDFKNYEETIIVHDKSSFQAEQNMVIDLIK